MKHVLSLIFVTLITACAAPVSVDYDHATNFAAIKSYGLVATAVNDSQDTRLGNPFMYKRIAAAIESRLADKGMTRTDSKSADVVVEYHLQVESKIHSDDTGVSIGFGTGSRHSAIGFVYSIPIGGTSQQDNLVITIDMVDNKTGDLLWRGSYGQTVYEGSSPETNTSKVNYIVSEILKKYPPR